MIKSGMGEKACNIFFCGIQFSVNLLENKIEQQTTNGGKRLAMRRCANLRESQNTVIAVEVNNKLNARSYIHTLPSRRYHGVFHGGREKAYVLHFAGRDGRLDYAFDILQHNC